MTRADLQKRPDEVAGMFDQVAKGYDRTNAVLSAGNSALWRAATTAAVDPVRGERILDLAAGTGTSSAALKKRGVEVVGLDLSAGMIEVARKRHRRIEFLVGDAEHLPFGDDEFDAVTISFGLRNVNDPLQALREMFRVLKPGGRLVICEFSRPTASVIRGSYRFYLRRLLPLVAKATGTNGPAYRYLGESIEAWPDQQTLSQWIRGVGFTRVEHRDLTGGIVALHRGRKPEDPAVLASAARRAARRADAQPTARERRSGSR